jgi:hypothetical protein
VGDSAQVPVVRNLIERLRADPNTVDGAVEAVRRQSPLFDRLPEPQLRRHVAALLDAAATAFSSGAAEEGRKSAGEIDLGDSAAVVDRLAFDRILQGMPLAAVLDGFQAGRVYALSRLIDLARTEDATDELFDALNTLDAYSHELRNRLIDAYRSREAELERNGYGLRTRALRDLLHGDPAAAPPEALLRPDRRYHCMIAEVTDPRHAAPTEAVLASGGGVSGFVDGRLCGVSPKLPPAERVADLLVIATPAVPVSELAAAYRTALATVAAVRGRNLRGLRTVGELAVATAVHAQPRIGRYLARDLLASLDPRDEFHRLLAETALAYLDHGRRTDATAAALHVHPNTVKHRLRRFTALTQFDEAPESADTLEHAVRWWWALRVWLA